MGELFQAYLDADEDWLASSVVQTHSSKHSLQMTGNEAYVSYKDLKAEHGEELATRLRDDKKRRQAQSGDLLPDVPHWFAHPDFPDVPAAWPDLECMHDHDVCFV